MVRAVSGAAKSPVFQRFAGVDHVEWRARRRRAGCKIRRRGRPLREAQAVSANGWISVSAPSIRNTPGSSGPTADPSAFARGFRLSAELVAGVLVGAGIGWLLDRWLETLPWGMFVFALLGFTAGVLNVMRQAGAGAARAARGRDDRQAP